MRKLEMVQWAWAALFTGLGVPVFGDAPIIVSSSADCPGYGGLELPFCRIQDAIDIAEDGDEIWVLGGAPYTGLGNTELDLQGKAIRILGSRSGPYQTVIDGLGTARAFHFQNGEGGSTIIEDIIIRNGNGFDQGGGGILLENGAAPTLSGLLIENCWAWRGGGIASVGGGAGTLVIENCEIRNNEASKLGGGGVFLGFQSSAVIRNSIIQANRADIGHPGSAPVGGGIFMQGAPLLVEDCRIERNLANGEGGGIYLLQGYPEIKNCMIAENRAGCDFDNDPDCSAPVGAQGGGIGGGFTDGFNFFEPFPQISGCTIAGNKAGFGGGIALYLGGADVRSSVLVANQAERGGAVYSEESSPIFANCTIVDNVAERGGGVYQHLGSATINNSILWGNLASDGDSFGDQVYVPFGSGYIRHCNVHEGEQGVRGPQVDYNDDGGNTNFQENPEFVDNAGADGEVLLWEDNDYALIGAIPGTLELGSPCIDRGNSLLVPLNELDLNGAVRVQDDPFTLNSGVALMNAPCRVVDVGAIELMGIAVCMPPNPGGSGPPIHPRVGTQAPGSRGDGDDAQPVQLPIDP